MDLPIHTMQDAPAASRAVLEGIAADLGLVPNLAAVAAGSPALLAGFDGMRRAVGATGLDPVLREVAGLAVGVVVDNRYGIAFHSTMLAGLGMSGSDLAAVRSGSPPSDPAAAAVHSLATEAASRGGDVTDQTISSAGGRAQRRRHPRGAARGGLRELRRPDRQPRRTRRARRLPPAPIRRLSEPSWGSEVELVGVDQPLLPHGRRFDDADLPEIGGVAGEPLPLLDRDAPVCRCRQGGGGEDPHPGTRASRPRPPRTGCDRGRAR